MTEDEIVNRAAEDTLEILRMLGWSEERIEAEAYDLLKELQ